MKAILGAVLAALLGVSAARAAEPLPTIWFHSQVPGSSNNAPGVGADFMHLWDTPNNGWPRAQAHTAAYVFGQEWITRAATADLKTAFGFLRANHMQIGMVWEGPLSPGPKNCGQGWAAFHASENPKIISAFKAAGDHPDFFQMDEPLQNAHYLAKKKGSTTPGCQYPISKVAQLIAKNVATMKTAFPSLVIGDIEPFADFPSTWQADTIAWKSDWQTSVGSPLAFIIDDLQWGAPGQPDFAYLTKLQATVHPVPFGMNFDGLGQVTPGSDYNWMQACEDNMRLYTQNMGAPDIAQILSFQNWPALALPETDNTRLTAAIDYYMSLFGW